MAWNNRRRGYSSVSNPPPPRAFMGQNEHLCTLAIKKMAQEQRWLATRHITIEDFRQLFVPAEYRDPLKVAYSVAEMSRYRQDLNVRVVQTGENYPEEYPMPVHPNTPLVTSFTWDWSTSKDGFFVMSEYEPVFQHDAPQELVEKFLYVSDNLLRISYEFGLVNAVFSQLNQNGYCNTPQQMRFVWPAIRHIVDKAGLKGLDLTEASARAGDRARAPVTVASHLVPTMNIVNRAGMIDKVNMDAKREFVLNVNTPQFQVGELMFAGVN